MSSKKIILCCVLTLIFSEMVNSQIDSINNISVIQRTDGSKILDIYYDLYGPEYYYNIEIQVSFNGGASYNKIDSLEGDWDIGVSSKTNRHAIWFAGKEHPAQYYDDALIKIISSTEYFTCGVSKMTHDGLEYGTAMHEGRCWLDRNLGASQVKTSDFDSLSFGGAYQWGRLTDGHQYRYSGTTSSLSGSDVPGHDDFILTTSAPDDWRSPQNDNLWQGVNGINNPCPPGFKVPTKSEWDLALLNISQMLGNLHIPLVGYRNPSNGIYVMPEPDFYYITYWSSTTSGTEVYTAAWNHFYIEPGTVTTSRGSGFPVRCISSNTTSLEKPAYLAPDPGSTGVTEFVNLSWTHSDPTVEFDVFFGTDSNPSLVDYHSTNTTFDPGMLNFYTEYFWKVVAIYPSGIAISSDLWSFTTGGFVCGPSIIEHSDIIYSTVVYQDRCWLEMNLGASQVAGSPIDVAAYGDYYQWGRLMDGHQSPASTATTTLSGSDVPGHDQFILSAQVPFDWRNPQNDALWQGGNGINNPCPDNWHVPSTSEWEIASAGWIGTQDAFDSPLKLVSAGARSGTDGVMLLEGSDGFYWSKSPHSNNADNFHCGFANTNIQNSGRHFGYPIRCIKDLAIELPSNPIPSDGSTLYTKYLDLFWSCDNPNGDTLFYDIYFGQNATPALLETSYTDTVYDLNTLEYNKTYYWKIVARDNFGTVIEGDVWSFTVADFSCGQATIEFDSIIYGTVGHAGYCWLDRNLGAERVPLDVYDTLGYGDLYQWGRLKDGHEYAYSELTSSLSSTANPGHDKFIVFNPDPYYHWDWMASPDPARWQGVNGLNNPCPDGWYVPDGNTIQNAIDNLPNPSDPFDSPLKVPFCGGRNGNTWTGIPGGQLIFRHTAGMLWSSTYTNAYRFSTSSAGPDWDDNWPANAYGIRCVYDGTVENQPPNPPSNPWPVDGAQNIMTDMIILSWSCSDPDSYELTYDFYFGTDPDPPFVGGGFSDNNWTLTNLIIGTIYHWKIVAHDDFENTTVGPVWQFTTEFID